MSVTERVLEKLYLILSEKKEGITTTELWDYILNDDDLKKFMYLGKTRRTGIIAGLTKRIKKGKKSTDGLRVQQNDSGVNVFILESNFSYLNKTTNNYLEIVEKINLREKNKIVTKREKELLKEYRAIVVKLSELNEKLSLLGHK